MLLFTNKGNRRSNILENQYSDDAFEANIIQYKQGKQFRQ